MAMSEQLWIKENVFLDIIELVKQRFPLETGGMLLGYESYNGEGVVTAIIGPGPRAKHSRYRFKPDAEYQQRELEIHYFRTNGSETYLGDWHSHPRGSNALSHIDKRTLFRIASTPSSGTIHPIMVIIGGEQGNWEPAGTRFISCQKGTFFNNYELRPLLLRYFSIRDQPVLKKKLFPITLE